MKISPVDKVQRKLFAASLIEKGLGHRERIEAFLSRYDVAERTAQAYMIYAVKMVLKKNGYA